jgi:hypothetical protein
MEDVFWLLVLLFVTVDHLWTTYNQRRVNEKMLDILKEFLWDYEGGPDDGDKEPVVHKHDLKLVGKKTEAA